MASLSPNNFPASGGAEFLLVVEFDYPGVVDQVRIGGSTGTEAQILAAPGTSPEIKAQCIAPPKAAGTYDVWVHWTSGLSYVLVGAAIYTPVNTRFFPTFIAGTEIDAKLPPASLASRPPNGTAVAYEHYWLPETDGPLPLVRRGLSLVARTGMDPAVGPAHISAPSFGVGSGIQACLLITGMPLYGIPRIQAGTWWFRGFGGFWGWADAGRGMVDRVCAYIYRAGVKQGVIFDTTDDLTPWPHDFMYETADGTTLPAPENWGGAKEIVFSIPGSEVAVLNGDMLVFEVHGRYDNYADCSPYLFPDAWVLTPLLVIDGEILPATHMHFDGASENAATHFEAPYDIFAVESVYAPPPTITSVTPNNSRVQGTSVEIVGTGFNGTTGVLFGAAAATGVVVVDDTHIQCVAPAHALGVVDVTVQRGDGASGMLANGFTYRAVRLVVTPGHGTESGGTLVTVTRE